MTINIDEIRTPSWIKLKPRYPLSYDKTDRFNEVFPQENSARFLGDVGREGGWKFPGYNPNHNSTRTETFDLRSDQMPNLKPY